MSAERQYGEVAGRAPRLRDGDVVPFREATKAWFAISLQTL